jgi:hypothetical protein
MYVRKGSLRGATFWGGMGDPDPDEHVLAVPCQDMNLGGNHEHVFTRRTPTVVLGLVSCIMLQALSSKVFSKSLLVSKSNTIPSL